MDLMQNTWFSINKNKIVDDVQGSLWHIYYYYDYDYLQQANITFDSLILTISFI